MTPDLVAQLSVEGRACYAEPLDDDTFALLEGSWREGFRRTGQTIARATATFLPPLRPTKIIGIGANFPGDEATPGVPSFFIKSPTAVTAHLTAIRLPPVFRSALAEGELGVVLREGGRNVSRLQAADLILGYTIVNDLSGRDPTLEVVPPAAKKSADTFAPMGPYLNLDPTLRTFDILTRKNGEDVQRGNTRDLIFDIAECLSFISTIVTLEPFDVIAMGTPPPKPKLVAGDEVSVAISGLGTLTNWVE